MSKAIAEIAAGAAIIALDVVSFGAATPLLMAGVSLIIAGIGTLLSNQHQGIAANLLNPVAPWNVVYGQARVGGTTIWQQTNGDTDKFWHRVIVLACHPCNSVDALIFDDKRVCLDTSGNSLSFGGSTAVQAFQQTIGILSISRVNDVVTVVMSGPMPLPATSAAGPALMTGDTVQIQNVSGDHTLNGQYQILLVNPTTFTYICGGNPISTGPNGQVKTQWPDYGDTIHFEMALGGQGPSNPPFPGLLATDGTGSNGTWTTNHIVQGRTAVYLRMKYGGNTYQPGIPTLGFLVSGKNDIFDPRFSSNGYTANSALCIADFLANQTWGFKLNYGTDIPTAALVSAANICDESVSLAAGGFEARYTCNGSFQLTAKRGEILSNLLTSCGGRVTYSGGLYVINPAAWTGTTVQIGTAIPTNLAGSPITSATLNVWASYAQGSSGLGSPAISGVFGPFSNAGLIAIGPHVSSIIQGFDFDVNAPGPVPTHLTQAISVDQLGLLSQLQLVAGIVGTLFGTDTGAGAVLNVYDVNLFVTYADSTTGTIRPVATATQRGTAGTVTNQQNAIDADTNPPTTFASVNRTQYDGVAFMGYLQLSNFAFPTTNNVTPGALTLQYAAGPFQWKPVLAIRDLFNGVKGTYVSPVNNWQASDMPPYAQDTDHGYAAPGGTTGYYDQNVAADGGDRRWFDMQFPFTDSSSMAQRLAKIELLRRRSQGMGTFAFNLAMYQLTALDVVSMTLPYLGWTDKLLEVTSHRFTVQKHDDSGQIALGTELDLQETDPSVYEWSTSEELSPEGFGQPTLTGTQTIAAPVGVALTSGAGVASVGADGVATSRVQITWTAPTDGFITGGGYTIVQYSLDDTNWIGLGQFDASVTSTYIPQVTDGQEYWVRIAFVNVAGVQSAWTVEGPITATGSSSNLHFIYDEVPAGTIDGSNPTFTLSQTPSPPASLQLFQNGDLLIQGVDYTLSANVITIISTIPIPGDSLRAWYPY